MDTDVLKLPLQKQEREIRLDTPWMRLFDIVLSIIGLVLLAPVLLVVSVAIKLQDGGPVLYRGRRVGKNGVLFDQHKFRTMSVGADRQGPGITAQGDARITPLGHWLRRSKIDEVPQLWDVLRGKMALVGPRPEDPRYVALYTPLQRQVLAVRPGMTSPASLQFRNEEQHLTGPDWEHAYRTQIMPAKLELELSYLTRRNHWKNLALLFRTVRAVFQ